MMVHVILNHEFKVSKWLFFQGDQRSNEYLFQISHCNVGFTEIGGRSCLQILQI